MLTLNSETNACIRIVYQRNPANHDDINELSTVYILLSLGLKIFLEDIMGRAFLAPIAYDARRTLDNFSGLSLLINFAETSPFTQLHVRVNLNLMIKFYYALII